MADESGHGQEPWPDAHAHDFKKTESLRGNASTRLIKALIDSMTANGWLGGPIDVVEINSEKYVINGHHRVFAARIAKIKVPYRIISNEQLVSYGYGDTDQVVIAHAEAGTHRIRLR